jgi:hypothetical protein
MPFLKIIRCRVRGSGFRVDVSDSGVNGSSFRVDVSDSRVNGSSFRVDGSGFRIDGSDSRVDGSGFRVDRSGFRVDRSGFRVRFCLLRSLNYKNSLPAKQFLSVAIASASAAGALRHFKRSYVLIPTTKASRLILVSFMIV